jgi:hypothetical protein
MYVAVEGVLTEDTKVAFDKGELLNMAEILLPSSTSFLLCHKLA